MSGKVLDKPREKSRFSTIMLAMQKREGEAVDAQARLLTGRVALICDNGQSSTIHSPYNHYRISLNLLIEDDLSHRSCTAKENRP